jgi:hypothetical protein
MSPHRTINIKKLAPGDTLVQAVFSEGLTKLLGSGCAVSQQLIKRLAERGVTEVIVEIPADRSEKHQRNAVVLSNVRPETIIEASRLVEYPCQCGCIIAIQAPAADLPVAAWICKACGAAYFGGVNATKNDGVELLVTYDGNSLTGDHQSQANATSAPTKVDASAANSPSGRERRQQTRYSIGVPVVVVPLAADFTITGPAVKMMTRDISKSGVALVSARFSNAPYYVVDFTAAGIDLLQVLMKVLRVSNRGPNYEVAGKFINRLHCADWRS